ncbi:hypothetical protein E0L36_22575 [Streptomyces sp. AJS327]|uniref:hypothetical protein n=1 Tax=Streptomyces sp. AJS327 TaxID=2545265 RepID=UPI0015DD90B2|nr:hypothetical protein [Streptomyces sp. AJS327]MBA0053559.1 hypothetical protein [Streptomyces sp. AJS327]
MAANARVLPGERSLVLEPSPAAYSSSTAQQGFAQHQVGGLPGWITESEPHPRCPGCETATPYLVTVAGGLTPFGEMPFHGNLYCFWCDTCRVACLLLRERDW